MKRSICLMCVLFLQCNGTAFDLTEPEYLRDVYYGFDRTSYPLHKDQCYQYPYNQLLSCQLLEQDKNELKQISEDNLSYALHYWKEVEDGDSYAIVPEDSSQLYTAYTYHTQLLKTSTNYHLLRKRRSLDTAMSPLDGGKSRKKRGIPGNPCSSDVSVREVVYEAPDAKNPKIIYELYQNPDENFYQTYYIRQCLYDYFFQFKCKVEYVDHISLVYIGNSFKVEPRLIKIPALCAISV